MNDTFSFGSSRHTVIALSLIASPFIVLAAYSAVWVDGLTTAAWAALAGFILGIGSERVIVADQKIRYQQFFVTWWRLPLAGTTAIWDAAGEHGNQPGLALMTGERVRSIPFKTFSELDLRKLHRLLSEA